MKVKEWIINEFLPILISVVLTGLMTIFITYSISNAKDEKELEYIAYETYVDLINLRHKVDTFNNNITVSDEVILLELMKSSINTNERMKLLKILTKEELNRLMGIYTQGEALDDIMDMYYQALLSEDDILINSFRTSYFNEMKNPLITGDIEEWDTILMKLSNYLKVKNIAE